MGKAVVPRNTLLELIEIPSHLHPAINYFTIFTGEQHGGSLRYVRSHYNKLNIKVCHPPHVLNLGDVGWLYSQRLWHPDEIRIMIKGQYYGRSTMTPEIVVWRDIPKELQAVHHNWRRILTA